MKKLILAILLLTGVSFAQTGGVSISGNSIWTDSLGYGTVATSDSVWILKNDFSYEWYRIFVEGNANSPVDSFVVQAGTIRYNEKTKAAVDTIWGSFATVKDSAWGSINTMINNTVGKDFTLFNPAAQLLKFSLLNHRGGLVTRNVTITINAKK